MLLIHRMVDLDSLRGLKNEYRIGTKAALDYLRVEKAHQDLINGIEPADRRRPSSREVANL